MQFLPKKYDYRRLVQDNYDTSSSASGSLSSDDGRNDDDDNDYDSHHSDASGGSQPDPNHRHQHRPAAAVSPQDGRDLEGDDAVSFVDLEAGGGRLAGVAEVVREETGRQRQGKRRRRRRGSIGMECVVCMVPVRATRRGALTTPCSHVFHEACLIEWMDIKMECPVCRQPLPPL